MRVPRRNYVENILLIQDGTGHLYLFLPGVPARLSDKDVDHAGGENDIEAYRRPFGRLSGQLTAVERDLAGNRLATRSGIPVAAVP